MCVWGVLPQVGYALAVDVIPHMLVNITSIIGSYSGVEIDPLRHKKTSSEMLSLEVFLLASQFPKETILLIRMRE